MVAHACNPSYSGDRDRRIMAQDQPKQKVSETLCQETSQAWWYTSVIPATPEAEVGDCSIKLAWAKAWEPI
jgi:hypothetical protein